MRRRWELSCSPSLSGDRSGLTGAGGFGDREGAGAHQFRCHLLCFHGGVEGDVEAGRVGRGSGQEKT